MSSIVHTKDVPLALVSFPVWTAAEWDGEGKASNDRSAGAQRRVWRECTGLRISEDEETASKASNAAGSEVNIVSGQSVGRNLSNGFAEVERDDGVESQGGRRSDENWECKSFIDIQAAE